MHYSDLRAIVIVTDILISNIQECHSSHKEVIISSCTVFLGVSDTFSAAPADVNDSSLYCCGLKRIHELFFIPCVVKEQMKA